MFYESKILESYRTWQKRQLFIISTLKALRVQERKLMYIWFSNFTIETLNIKYEAFQ